MHSLMAGGAEVEPFVKITLSPNTPSPEPREDEEDDRESELVELSVVEKQENKVETFSSSEVPSSSNASEQQQQQQQWKAFKDVPICVDFGIQDYLCRGHEGELDLSSDTDTSYLGATPPHRFSDGEIDPIEAMPVLLDTELNLSTPTAPPDTSEGAIVPVGRRMPLSCSLTEAPKFLTEFPEQTLFRRVNNPLGANKIRPVPRPFRRNISLPAAIFKTFLVEQTPSVPGSVLGDTGSSSGPLVCIAGSVSSCPAETSPAAGGTAIVRLGTIDSISNSSQVNLLEMTEDEDGGNTSASQESILLHERSLESAWNSGDSLDSESNDLENQPFTSELEKRSLIIRHMRRLIRQDTTGNFAPPDFHI